MERSHRLDLAKYPGRLPVLTGLAGQNITAGEIPAAKIKILGRFDESVKILSLKGQRTVQPRRFDGNQVLLVIYQVSGINQSYIGQKRLRAGSELCIRVLPVAISKTMGP